MRRLIALLAVLGLLLAACSSDPTASEEYQDLEQQLADTEQELAEVTAARDALAATAGESSDRYEKSLANQEAVEDILHNPDSYGSEEEVVELLASYATEDAVMDDEVFGAVPIKNAWYFTLYSGTMDAEIDNYYRWLSDDGSQGGVLWLWHGTNTAGNPFELAGIALDEYDENGLIKYEYVVYPYPDDYVRNAKDGSGTAQVDPAALLLGYFAGVDRSIVDQRLYETWEGVVKLDAAVEALDDPELTELYLQHMGQGGFSPGSEELVLRLVELTIEPILQGP